MEEAAQFYSVASHIQNCPEFKYYYFTMTAKKKMNEYVCSNK